MQRQPARYLIAYTESIFVERVPFRLSNVKDIPYPDVLHLYDSTINGFQQLTQVVPYFRIDEDQIGINENGKVKVWLNPDFSTSRVIKGQYCR